MEIDNKPLKLHGSVVICGLYHQSPVSIHAFTLFNFYLPPKLVNWTEAHVK